MNIYHQAIIELTNALNSNGIYKKSILCHCQALQNELWLNKKIWNTYFKTAFNNFREIYNKFYITKIIDIAHNLSLNIKPTEDYTFPVSPIGGTQT